jgi:hypothetical protein
MATAKPTMLAIPIDDGTALLIVRRAMRCSTPGV